MSELLLEVTDYQGPTRWRWTLTGTDAQILASHDVQLDADSWQCRAFSDLSRYLRLHATTEGRAARDSRRVAEIGGWIGEHVFGQIGVAIAESRPATVRMIIPERADYLMALPFQAAYIGGAPITRQDITLVMQNASESTAPADGRRPGQLRFLGLFSLPEGGRPLNLRHERTALARLFSRIADSGVPVQARMLQYGVTRERLKEVLADPEGWDIIHVSGHGAPGELLLETEEGQPAPISGSELAKLLRQGEGRPQLVTVSACWSAAMAQRHLLGLPLPRQPRQRKPDPAATGNFASDLAKLGCAVLAMRYPVADSFAVALSERLYGLLLSQGTPLPQALGNALSELTEGPAAGRYPPLSAATPALFGSAAASLKLGSSPGPRLESAGPDAGIRGNFPPPPERFVGRTRVMAGASAALAPRSGVPGVLLSGMPGAGKTACALELADTHRHAFTQTLWFKVPAAQEEAGIALVQFTRALEEAFPSLKLTSSLDDPGTLPAAQAELARQLHRNRAMIVIDNVDSLLAASGQWRDSRWGGIIGAICAHQGPSRVVMTSRRVPAGLHAGIRHEAVDALSLDEALLLARDLPNLGRLINGSAPGITPRQARMLARDVLKAAQGHPKLLELADGQSADPVQLRKLVTAGMNAWSRSGLVPDGFFASGESQSGTADYLALLSAWTRSACDSLPRATRELFYFLCCLADDDLSSTVVAAVWADVRRHLDFPQGPPPLDAELAALQAHALIAIHHGQAPAPDTYRIHAAVAEAGRDLAGEAIQAAADATLAQFWLNHFDSAYQAGGDRVDEHLIRSGLRSLPYLLRQGRWQEAGRMLGETLYRSRSQQTARAVLPALRAVAASMANTPLAANAKGMLAKALEPIDPAEAERQTRAALDTALSVGDYGTAWVLGSDLVHMCLNAGRPSEALQVAEKQFEYTRLGQLGPWTRLNDEVTRLQVRLHGLGYDPGRALSEVEQMLEAAGQLPGRTDGDLIEPWAIREALLDTGAHISGRLGRWERALELNAAQVASARGRGAPDISIARMLFGDCRRLTELGNHDAAHQLLLECRITAERAGDAVLLSSIFHALSEAEHERGRGEGALSLARDALRYAYYAKDTERIRHNHRTYGIYLAYYLDRGDEGLAHCLAAALIEMIAQHKVPDEAMLTGVAVFRAAGARVPAGLADLSRTVDAVPGVDLRKLLEGLVPQPSMAERALSGLIAAQARIATVLAPPATARFLAEWDPVTAALLAEMNGPHEASPRIDRELTRCETTREWSALVPVLRRVRAGERHPDLTGLDEIDTSIIMRALDVLSGRTAVPVGLWRWTGLGLLLGEITAGACGDPRSAQRARAFLGELATDPALGATVKSLTRILDGERDLDEVLGAGHAGTDGGREADHEVIACILYHVNSATQVQRDSQNSVRHN